MHTPDVRAAARKAFQGRCRVCAVCNGKACAGEVPGMGGCGTGSSFQENVFALARYKLHMRTLHPRFTPETTCTLWGTDLALPVMGAPMAGIGPNMGAEFSERDVVAQIHAGCRKAGSLAWGGDGREPSMWAAALDVIASVNGQGVPTIKPRSQSRILEALRQAENAGVPAVALDVDAAGFQGASDDPEGFGPKSAEELAALVRATSVPLIVKGIMTVDEAVLAADAGAGGIVVSNHGGRVMDCLPGTAAVLPAIAGAVGHRLPVLADGGVRTGADVLKMLALGARAVLVGRPLLVAAAGGGSTAVEAFLTAMRRDLEKAMIMTGVPSTRLVPDCILFTD